MIASEIYSLFVFALVVGMGVLSHYFLHRMDAKPLTIEQEVIIQVCQQMTLKITKSSYLIRSKTPVDLLPNALIRI
jgi:hypothetical protein